MGKGRKHIPKRNFAEKRREKQKKKDEWDITPHHNYADIIRENKDFENYYKTEQIVPEEQWDSFINTMRKNLPVAFRITGSKVEAKALLETIKGDFFKGILTTHMEDDSKNNEETKPKDILQCLPFYPDGLAWQLQLTRKDIRRSEAYFRLHNFLIVETESGNISRQEVVSMVPPLVLDVKPHHKVLDMCAAPGSKTTQLIEMIHSDEESAFPEGFVIANDLDNNRCYMLVHQAKRLNSPIILITNHDASVLPNFTITKPDGTKERLKFDRILADVPCSGDGTMRKNPDIWCKWSPANGNNLHGIQFRIARRGLELLTVGGRMVYSTCSLNPVENEAVLHRLLIETGDSVRLVDCRDLVPGLVCDPGIVYCVLYCISSFLHQAYHIGYQHQKIYSIINRGKMYLNNGKHNMRILPHHQDTGGFFVAVLEKVDHLPWERASQMSDEVTQVIEDGNAELSLEQESKNIHEKRTFDDMNKLIESRRKRRRIARGFKEDPFVFFNDDKEEVWSSIKKFYDISDNLDPRCLLVRCIGRKKKNIYYTSPEIRNVVLSNEDQIKLINTGVKTFVRCDNKNMDCPFRLAQEGIQSIIKYIGDSRKIRISKNDLIMLLQNNSPHTPPEIVKLNPETQERLQNFATGSCILVYEEEETENPLKLQMVGWRGTMSLRAYVPVHDAIHYLRLLGADCSMYEKNKFKENRVSQEDSIVASEKLSNEVTSDADAVDVDIKKDIKSEPSDELKE
ncbi:hypothetical protein E2986_07733 [Frieseomelitta varia]|uniref:tRNA (cytosine(34)-C(5))-methyltransferase n=1 Tax=Frieseomelitta varia TaxID=561572 RepID=A0A833SIK5_9HYME|nr:hypothetical protein E2986_07733 [Frieseomelitta varia]